MNGSELIELENLRCENEIYKRYCTPEYFRELWVKGWKAKTLSNNLIENSCDCDDEKTMNEMWEDAKEEMWKEEMIELGLEPEDEILSELRGV